MQQLSTGQTAAHWGRQSDQRIATVMCDDRKYRRRLCPSPITLVSASPWFQRSLHWDIPGYMLHKDAFIGNQ